MDAAAIFALIEKGLTLLPILISAGQEIGTTIENLKNLASNAQAGTVTQDQLDSLEADLDASIVEFNAPME